MIFRAIILLMALIIAHPAFAARMPDQEIIKTGDVLRGRFTEERRMNGFNGPIRSEGHFIVAPAHGLIWTMEKPFRTTTVITPSGLTQMVGDAKVTYLPAQKMPFLLHLYDMLGGALAGNWKPLETEFTVKKDTQSNGWVYTLIPRHTGDLAMPYSLITVRGNQFVENVILKKADGDSDTLEFENEILSQTPLTIAENSAFSSVHP